MTTYNCSAPAPHVMYTQAPMECKAGRKLGSQTGPDRPAPEGRSKPLTHSCCASKTHQPRHQACSQAGGCSLPPSWPSGHRLACSLHEGHCVQAELLSKSDTCTACTGHTQGHKEDQHGTCQQADKQASRAHEFRCCCWSGLAQVRRSRSCSRHQIPGSSPRKRKRLQQLARLERLQMCSTAAPGLQGKASLGLQQPLAKTPKHCMQTQPLPSGCTTGVKPRQACISGLWRLMLQPQKNRTRHRTSRKQARHISSTSFAEKTAAQLTEAAATCSAANERMATATRTRCFPAAKTGLQVALLQCTTAEPLLVLAALAR